MSKKYKTEYLQMDLFIGFPGELAVRDEQQSMERNLFSLTKKKRTEPIVHTWIDKTNLKHTIKIVGDNELGIATIWDKDFLLYVISQLMEAKKRGGKPSPRLFIMPGEFFRWMGIKRVSGRDFIRFEAMVKRLQRTNVSRTSQVRFKDSKIKETEESWYWLIRYEFVPSQKDNRRGVEIWLDPVFYRQIVGSNVLHIDQDYFGITGGLARWCYEFFRKSAGVRGEGVWRISFRDLYAKSGVLSSFADFKKSLRDIVEKQEVVGYLLTISESSDSRNPYLMAQRRNCLPNDDPNFEYRELGNNNRYKENKKVWDEMNRQDAKQLADDLGLKDF